MTADWTLVDLDRDPAPGDVTGVRALAARLASYADLAATNRARLQQVAGDVSGGPLRMRGDYAAAYAEQFQELPGELAKLEKAYRGVAGALGRFAGRLDEAQGRARTALARGADAHDRFWWARRSADAALPAGHVLPWGVHGLSVAQADAATSGLDETVRTQVRAAVSRAVSARSDQDTAARLAREAAALRGEAEASCVDEIHAALDGSGIKNRSWLQKAWDSVSAPFRSWDAFVSLCEKVALVAGVVALFVSGPVGWAIMAASLAAGAVILADKLDKYARGQASLLDVGLAVLGVVPGGHGVLSLGKMALGAKGLAVALRAGGGKLLGNGAFGLRTMIPHGLAVAGGLRGALRDPALFARGVVCRAFKADPIDLSTGEMYVSQTDLDLPVAPGMPGIVVSRVHQSSYQVGHRFGRAWNTTLDHRLEVDDAGVTWTGAGGLVLQFPHAADGVAVLPSHGPSVRLTRTAVPDLLRGVVETYAVHDPVSGLTELYTTDLAVPGVTALPIGAVVDRAGRAVRYRYDGDGELVAIEQTDATGRVGYRVRVTTVDGRISSLTVDGRAGGGADGDVLVVRYGYDAAGRLTHVVNSSGLAMTYEYDNAGRVVRWVDRNGTWYGYRYDETGRCTAAEGTGTVLRARFEYDVPDAATPPGGTTTRFTDSLGNTSVWTSDARHRVVRRVDPLGRVHLQEWDDRNALLASTDPLGRTTRFGVDPDGRPAAVTLPDGATATTEYDTAGLPARSTDPTGAAWTFVHDGRGLPVSATDPLGTVTTYAWTAGGTLAAVTDPAGTTSLVCDPAGLPVVVTDATGVRTHVDRDPLGRPATVTDAAGSTHLTWDVEGRLVHRVDAAGAVWTWTYDAEGNLREAVDPLGHPTRVTPTAWDQPAVVTTADGATTRYDYDTERRLVQVTNPLGLTWHYRYDPEGRLVGETDFDGRTTTLARDAAGQVVARTGASGTLELGHDAAGRVVRQVATPPGGDPVETRFGYDRAGRLVRATSPDADLELVRDLLGRVTAETTTDVHGTRTLTSAYDAVGRRTGRRTPSGAVSTWSWDAAGRPLGLDTGRPGGRVDVGHDELGRPVRRSFGSTDLVVHRTVTGLPAGQRLTGPAGHGVLDRAYAYAADGHLLRVDDLVRGTSTEFELDPLRRITAAGAERYAYDLDGTVADGPVDGDPPAAPQGRRSVEGTRVVRAGRTTYTYDAAGRTVSRRTRLLSGGTRTWSYTWDALDRLVECMGPDGRRTTFAHDPLGRRTARRGPDGVTTYTWDGTVVAEQESLRPDRPRTATSWDHGPDGFTPWTQRVRRSGAGVPGDEDVRLVVTDLVGAPTELVAPDGTVTWRRRRTVWGAPTGDGPARDDDCPLIFPGVLEEPATGLGWTLFRHYDPDLARWASPDPWGLDGGPHPTAYVPNPTRWADPLGLTPGYGAADFVVDSKGVAIPTSRARLEQGFQDAGFPRTPTTSPGTQYTMPDGTLVRVMEPSSQAPLRASFTSATGGHVSPFTGKPVQPPPGVKGPAWKQLQRELTHLELTP